MEFNIHKCMHVEEGLNVVVFSVLDTYTLWWTVDRDLALMVARGKIDRQYVSSDIHVFTWAYV